MTLRLILIRHAKSSWNDPFADDHARVLNNRGQASGTAIGGWLAQNGYRPDLILCSDAVRTVETASLIMPAFEDKPKLQRLGSLYHAAPDTILGLIQKQTAPVLAVIGHNPGIGMLANGLARAPADYHRFSDYPTCATTVLDFDGAGWRAIRPKAGTMTAFVVPRDLIGIDKDGIS